MPDGFLPTAAAFYGGRGMAPGTENARPSKGTGVYKQFIISR